MADKDYYTEEETVARRDEALLRALNTPPKRHSEMKLGKRKSKTSAKANPPKKRGPPPTRNHTSL